jgi:cytoskeleton-associated protein 5
VLLEKFKDKASVVNKAATEALEAMARYCFTLADVAEDVAAALVHQNPKVKEGTLSWLTTCITRETKQGVTKLMPVVVPAAAKRTDEGAPSIREAAFGFLVQAALKVSTCPVLRTCNSHLIISDETGKNASVGVVMS